MLWPTHLGLLLLQLLQLGLEVEVRDQLADPLLDDRLQVLPPSKLRQ
jgi:hypothetical protein